MPLRHSVTQHRLHLTSARTDHDSRSDRHPEYGIAEQYRQRGRQEPKRSKNI